MQKKIHGICFYFEKNYWHFGEKENIHICEANRFTHLFSSFYEVFSYQNIRKSMGFTNFLDWNGSTCPDEAREGKMEARVLSWKYVRVRWIHGMWNTKKELAIEKEIYIFENESFKILKWHKILNLKSLEFYRECFGNFKRKITEKNL